MRTQAAGLALAMVATTACGAARSPEPAAPSVVVATDDERVATFGLADQVAWPYWLHRLQVRVGDDTVVDARYDRDEPRPRWLTHTKLPPGEHAVVVVAEVAFASTRLDGGDGCVVRLEGHAALDLRRGHATVDVGLRHRGGATTPFAERVALHLAPRQGTVTPGRRSRSAPTAAICDDRAPLLETSPASRSLWRGDAMSPLAHDWPHAGW